MGFPAPAWKAKRPEVVASGPFCEKKQPLPACGASEPAVALIAMLVRPGARAAACAVTQLCCASMEPTAYGGVSKLQV